MYPSFAFAHAVHVGGNHNVSGSQARFEVGSLLAGIIGLAYGPVKLHLISSFGTEGVFEGRSILPENDRQRGAAPLDSPFDSPPPGLPVNITGR